MRAVCAGATSKGGSRSRVRETARGGAGKRKAARTDAGDESVSLWFRLLGCHAMMLSELRRELEDRTTLARFDLLASLARQDGQTLAGLSRALLVTAGNVTGLVDRAERDGVVERRAEPSDRRVARVWLTREGRALIRELLPLHARQVHELIGELPAQDRRELRRLLGVLRDLLAKRASRSSVERS
jgi:DNA-binding MarR family transcriptional regulator